MLLHCQRIEILPNHPNGWGNRALITPITLRAEHIVAARPETLVFEGARRECVAVRVLAKGEYSLNIDYLAFVDHWQAALQHGQWRLVRRVATPVSEESGSSCPAPPDR